MLFGRPFRVHVTVSDRRRLGGLTQLPPQFLVAACKPLNRNPIADASKLQPTCDNPMADRSQRVDSKAERCPSG
jgi:hypothetical protein